MHQEGKVQFLHHHQGSVRGVAFSPKDRYLFCSGAYDGKVNLYSAQRYELLMSYQITTMSLARNVNAVRFTSDASRILATTTAKRLAVIDIEHGEQLMSYDNCAFYGRDRTGLAVDPICPNMAACCCMNGKGISLFDLRMPLPLDYIYDLHQSTIRDLTFLNSSWPWVKGQSAIMSVSVDGLCKITTLDGRNLYSIEAKHPSYTVCPTPEVYGSGVEDGFASVVMLGGDLISAFVPDVGIQETLSEHGNTFIWKLRYTSNGSTLYSACDKGTVRRYRRNPDRHEYLGEVYSHKNDIEDMDISPFDEYLITASQDRSVGIIKLGSPNHGWTEYGELT